MDPHAVMLLAALLITFVVWPLMAVLSRAVKRAAIRDDARAIQNAGSDS